MNTKNAALTYPKYVDDALLQDMETYHLLHGQLRPGPEGPEARVRSQRVRLAPDPRQSETRASVGAAEKCTCARKRHVNRKVKTEQRA
jgi:hypothetical protein